MTRSIIERGLMALATSRPQGFTACDAEAAIPSNPDWLRKRIAAMLRAGKLLAIGEPARNSASAPRSRYCLPENFDSAMAAARDEALAWRPAAVDDEDDSAEYLAAMRFTHRHLEAGQYVVEVPAKAVRSVFELGAQHG